MGIELPQAKIDFEVGDTVKVITGPFENSVGVINQIHDNKRTVIVRLSMFGRETPVELDFTQIQKI